MCVLKGTASVNSLEFSGTMLNCQCESEEDRVTESFWSGSLIKVARSATVELFHLLIKVKRNLQRVFTLDMDKRTVCMFVYFHVITRQRNFWMQLTHLYPHTHTQTDRHMHTHLWCCLFIDDESLTSTSLSVCFWNSSSSQSSLE